LREIVIVTNVELHKQHSGVSIQNLNTIYVMHVEWNNENLLERRNYLEVLKESRKRRLAQIFFLFIYLFIQKNVNEGGNHLHIDNKITIGIKHDKKYDKK